MGKARSVVWIHLKWFKIIDFGLYKMGLKTCDTKDRITTA